MTARANCLRDGERGWSLLEVMISFAILSTLLASLMSTRAGEARYVAETRDETAAHRVAAARLERLSAGTDRTVAGRREFTIEEGLAPVLPGARASEEVREAGPGLFAVEVRVTWATGGGERREYVLATLVVPGGAR